MRYVFDEIEIPCEWEDSVKFRVEEKEVEEEIKEESDEESEEERSASCGILPRSRDIEISRFLLVAIPSSGLYKGLLFKSNE